MNVLRIVFSVILILSVHQIGLAQQQISKESVNLDSFAESWKELAKRPAWLVADNLDMCPYGLFPAAVAKRGFDWAGCNTDPATCLDECKSANGWACYGLALAVQKRKGPVHEVSELLFLRSCKLGVTSGCTNRAASMLDLNANDPEAMICVANTFEKSCGFDDAWGCTMFGLVLMEGIGLQKDTERASLVLQKACKPDGKKSEACVRANELIQLLKRDESSKPKN